MKRAVLFLGDSLTSGFGVSPQESFPSRIAQRLRETGHSLEVINGGIPGDTVEMASARMDYYFSRIPHIYLMVVFLGANDLLMGEGPEVLKQDLLRLIKRARELRPEMRLRLVGVGPFTGLPPAYQREISRVYEEVSRETDGPLIPFPLSDVVGRRALNLEDGLHPNAEGYAVACESLWISLLPEFTLPPE